MKTVLLIFAAIGAACALQFPLEYQYDYEGRLGMAIPRINAQASAMGIKARLVLQMKGHGVGIAQLKGVEAGTFIGDFHSNHIRARVPIRFSPLSTYTKQFEEPFNVNFLQEKDQVMVVSRDEPGWITNIRKGIVGAFLLDPLRSNHLGSLQVQGHQNGKVYSVEEESIFGRCRSIYSLTPYPSHMIPSIIQHMEKDIQSSQSKTPSTSSVPSIKDKYWKMVRTIDFDSCSDRVVLQHAGSGNYSDTGSGMFRSISARSSVGSYILKGIQGGFRVEKAIIEGSVVKNSFGFESEKMESLTNQTYVLRSVGPVSTPLRVPSTTKTVKTWRYEVTSPFPAPTGPQKLWVNYTDQNDLFTPVHPLYYLSGTTPSQQQYVVAKHIMMQLLDRAAKELSKFSPNDPQVPVAPTFNELPLINVARQLSQAQMIMLGLPIEFVEQAFTEVFMTNTSSQRNASIQQSLLIDVTAASGSAPALKVLFQKASGHISQQRLSTIFMSLTNSLTSPIIIPELMEVVLSKVDVTKYPGPQILINFANLLKRYCLNSKGFNYTLPNPIYGSHVCKPSLVNSKFVPYLRNQLMSASIPIYAKTGIMYAISTLGSPEMIDTLRPIALGVGPPELRDPLLRIASIFGLSSEGMPRSMRIESKKILLQLLEDVSQPTELRQVALMALISWQPDVAIWTKLARQTWHEPSKELAAFIYFTIDNMADSRDLQNEKQNFIAKYVRGLAKPFSPAWKYSYNFDKSSFIQHDKLALHFDWTKIFSPRSMRKLGSLFTQEMHFLLKPNIGGIVEDLAEVSISSEGFDPSVASFLQNIITSNVHKSTGMTPEGPKEHEPTVSTFAKIFDNMIQYLTLSSKDFVGQDAQRLFSKMVKGTTLNITKFMSPLTENFFVPTELGIPLIGMSSLPMVVQSDMEVQLKINTTASNPTIADMIKADSFSLVSKSYTKAVTRLFINLKALTPWNEQQIEVQIDNVRTLNLPVYANLTVINRPHLKNVTLNIAPLEGVQNLIPVYAHNIPFVALRPSILGGPSSIRFEPLTYDPDNNPLQKVIMSSSLQRTGIRGDIIFEGDVESPFSRGSIANFLSNPPKLMKLFSSPTAKYWRTYLSLQPETSPTKNISLSFSFTEFGKLFGSGSTSTSSSSQKGKLPQFSPQDTLQERLEKIQELTHDHDPTIAFNAQLCFNGSEFRKYEFLSVMSRQTPLQHDYKKFYLIMVLMANPMTSHDGQSRVLSVENKIETPNFVDASQMVQMIESGKIKQKVKGQVTYGPTTSSKGIVSFEMDVTLSQERKKLLKEEIHRLWAFDPLNPINHLRVPAVYDEAKIDLKYQNVPPQVMNTTMNITDFVKGMFYPFTHVDRYEVNNPQGQLKIKIYRPLWSNYYTLKTKAPRENFIMDHIYIPEVLSTFIPMGKLNAKWNQRMTDLELKPRIPSCSVKFEKVSTFDYLEIPTKNNLFCAAVAVKNHRNIRNSYEIYYVQKEPETMLVYIKLIKNKRMVEITYDQIVVDGQVSHQSKIELRDSRGKVILSVEKLPVEKTTGIVRAIIPGEIMFLLSLNMLLVFSFSKEKNIFRGICGDSDGSKINDMTGPRDCIYRNSTLYTLAWTKNLGPQCDSSAYNREYQEVTEFQLRCPKRGNKTVSLYEGSDHPFSFVYPIVKKDSYLCISEAAVKKCPQGYKMSYAEVEVPCKCWSQSQVPPEVVSGYHNGYLPHPVNQQEEVMKKLHFSQALSCH